MRGEFFPGPHSPYPWDYWPHEESRSECGYVGLTNLGATCYLASCIQHLFMIPQARESILSVNITDETKHSQTLYELQRMFAYLLVRKYILMRSTFLLESGEIILFALFIMCSNESCLLYNGCSRK